MGEGLFQPVHLILILGLVLIVFGPGKLPELGSALGKSIRELKRAMDTGANPADSGAHCAKCGAELAEAAASCRQCGHRPGSSAATP